ncbi:MAG: hypothetical protein KatS3mg019_2139 [Fimbriimonadales bacterium]|nr:MAG: hypothetical protein KatS3mg019_2139 [Fimbriimonadales bacterium]
MPKIAEAPQPTARKRKRRKPTPLEGFSLPDVEYLKNLELPEGEGEPLESDWHVVQIWLLQEVVGQLFEGQTDFFCGGNMFIYYSLEQVESAMKGNPLYKGPDFFFVKGVDGTKPRKSWVVWQEGGKYPNLIVELLSPTTARKDREDNKRLYAQVFRTPEYFWYDAFTGEFAGFCLREDEYVPITPNEQGWLWSHQLGAYLGVWRGSYHRRVYDWLRLYTAEGKLAPTKEELYQQALQHAEAERQRAEAERQRAEQLAQRLRALGVNPEDL